MRKSPYSIFKSYKVRLYPTQKQQDTMNKNFGSVRFIYNQMLAERIRVYESYKNGEITQKELYGYEYKTVKQYSEEFTFLKEVSALSLVWAEKHLATAYQNFYRRVKQGNTKAGFPKFKAKHRSKDSYTVHGKRSTYIKDGKLQVPKLGRVKMRGLPEEYINGNVTAVIISRTKSGKYFASIRFGLESLDTKERISDNILGFDLGLNKFMVCSNGQIIEGIKQEMETINRKIKKQHRHLSRKEKGSNRQYQCKLKLNRLYEYRKNYLDHFQWHLANKLCSENQVVAIENLNVAGMKQNKKLSSSIHQANWSSFVSKLEQKALEYGTTIYKVDRFFPSSKTCSKCGEKKDDLKLSDRTFKCGCCGHEIDRDLNAAINIRNNYLINKKSLEYSDYKRGEIVSPKVLIYQDFGSFAEALTEIHG